MEQVWHDLNVSGAVVEKWGSGRIGPVEKRFQKSCHQTEKMFQKTPPRIEKMFQKTLYQLDNKIDVCYSIGTTEERLHVKEKN